MPSASQLGSSAQLVVASTGEGDLREAQKVSQKIVIPMALPSLVGPGLLANVIPYGSEGGSDLLLDGDLVMAAMEVQFMVTGVSQIFLTQLAPALR